MLSVAALFCNDDNSIWVYENNCKESIFANAKN